MSIISVFFAFLIWDRQGLKSDFDAQKVRLESTTNQLRFASKNIAETYNFDFLPQCNNDLRYLTDNKLGLPVDVRSKAIPILVILNALDLADDDLIVRLVPSQKQVETDIDFYQNVNVDLDDNKYTIEYTGNNNKARPLDFQILIKRNNGQHCTQSMRLFFSDPVDSSGEWKVKSSIGRAGMGIGEFSLPYGTEFYEGRLWTTDCSNENISVFNLDGEFVDSFSQFGSALGRFDTPADMKIFNEKVYVVEERNHRVQVFSLDGEPLFLFGSYKDTDDPNLFVDKFNNPLGISVTDEQIVVVDYGNQRILAYDHDFNHIWTSGNEGGDPFDWHNPYYIEYSAINDHYLISNQTKSNIGIISPEGKKIKTFGSDVLVTPFEIAITNDGDAIVADTVAKQVVIFDGKNDYAIKHKIEFGENYGIPKTVTALSENSFLVGFVGNGPAYFLQLEKTDAGVIEYEPEGVLPAFIKSDKSKLIVDVKDSPENPRWVYSTYCSSCHEGSIYDAPARGNVEAWDRFPRDLDELLALAKVGKGAMIPKGGCAECSDEQLKETIKLLLPRTWE